MIVAKVELWPGGDEADLEPFTEDGLRLVPVALDAQEIEDFIVFTTQVGLPNTLTEIGLTPEDGTELRAVAEAATAH